MPPLHVSDPWRWPAQAPLIDATDLHTILGLAVNSYLLYAWHQYGGARCSTMLATWLFVMAASGLAMTVLAFGLVLYKKRRLRWYKQLLIAGEREPPVSIIFTLL